MAKYRPYVSNVTSCNQFLSLGKSSVGILGVCQYQHHHQHHHCQSDHLDQGYAREAGQASRCKRISRRCRSTDFACLRKPVIILIVECDVKKCLIKKVNFLISKVSLSFNFMSLVPMMRITGTGVDLFTMQSARVRQKSISIKEIVRTFYVFLSLHKHVIVCIIVIGGPSAE